MRISSGDLKGKKIVTKKGFSTRPLLSRVRKSLFDILGEGIRGKDFLDLYAGSGAVGIEALSRGAKRACFVEIDPECVKIIKENLIRCGVLEKARIYQADVLKILSFILKKEHYDFIFIGPPYFEGLQDKTLEIIESLNDYEGEVIVQHSPLESVDFKRENFNLIEERKYGDICLTFLFKRKDEK
ncbi:MAG TPA: 16S rRNA (guanine(966)-N(2))-methyltransferase RsmD [Candidatus Aerophobetes bacterium]|uniref:16S rRNA (Guanine(966)-N(2))-methyltransferase RsmD n=1 Tax=Aerophobetes bacterium TaxID=2030807 RepID=A0A7V5LZT2_UNCAE|nr:16S rRNA (guanine(966)-N(2))-methyltransferase RsmD [Candidatus Aerophobetes bacterium]